MRHDNLKEVGDWFNTQDEFANDPKFCQKGKNKLFLIAGHNGAGTGAIGYIDEGAETMALRNAIYTAISSTNASAFEGIISDNDGDRLSKVVSHINDSCSPYDLCIDIHFNAFNGKAQGTEVIIPKRATAIEQELSEIILLKTCAVLGTKNRGVKSESMSQYSRLAMLSGLRCNSVLLEVCFCDNDSDAEKYRANKETLITELAKSIVAYARSL